MADSDFSLRALPSVQVVDKIALAATEAFPDATFRLTLDTNMGPRAVNGLSAAEYRQHKGLKEMKSELKNRPFIEVRTLQVEGLPAGCGVRYHVPDGMIATLRLTVPDAEASTQAPRIAEVLNKHLPLSTRVLIADQSLPKHVQTNLRY